jgi:hypothetical protein
MLTAFGLALLALTIPAGAAQDAVPSFDVASVKPNVSGSGNSSMRTPPLGSVTATNVPLRGIAQAVSPTPAPRPTDDPASPCKFSMSRFNGSGTLSVSGWPLSSIVESLANVVGRIVVDRTAETGPFDLELKWSADGSVSPATATTLPDSAPSIFTAPQEQLGLKLESARGPVEVVVIDSVQHPTPD